MNFQLSSEYIYEVPSIYIHIYIHTYIYIYKTLCNGTRKSPGEKVQMCKHTRARAHTHTTDIYHFQRNVIPAIMPILGYIVLYEMGMNCRGRIKCMLSNKTQSGQTVSTSTCSSLKADTKNQYTIHPEM